MPAPGMPVASTITSMRGSAMSRGASATVARVLCASSSDRRRMRRGQPAVCSWLARARRQIGNGYDMHPARQARLRQKHGAEFSGADDADGDRTSGRLTLEQFGMQIHVWPLR